MVEFARGLLRGGLRRCRDRQNDGHSIASGGSAGSARRSGALAQCRCLACHRSARDRCLPFEQFIWGPGMSIKNDDLETLRETTSKALLAVVWLHVPIAVVIGVLCGTDWMMPAAHMAAM